MKIAIIGANGKAGQLIVKEAQEHGHQVTAIIRDRNKLTNKDNMDILERDLFQLTTKDMQNFDAVVSAFGLPFGGTHAEDAYQKAIEHLIQIFTDIPDVRLLIVGGAASLYTDPKKKSQFLEQIPEEWRAGPADMAKAFAKLKNSDVNWTYFSPAYTFDPDGNRTGSYVLGGDFAITNADNESYISYADYAIAMVDEIENAFHVKTRFTAVSDGKPKAPAPATKNETEYYGIMKKKPVFEGLSQYRPPFNYELSGKQFKLVMDKEKDFYVNFLSGNILEWSVFGDEKIWRENYECAKTSELTYFVNFELTGTALRTNISLVIDIEQRLVTFVRTYTGFHEKFPYLVNSDYDFGAIDLSGYSLPNKRHGFTSDMVGKRIHWHYSPSIEIIHVYYDPHYCRVTFPPNRVLAAPPPESNEDWERFPYDEPAVYIKIKEGIYFVSIIEQNMSRRGLTGNSLLFLMDLVRVHDVGRSFGHAGLKEGHVHPENYMFAAYGDFVYSDGELESKKNVYIE